MNTLLDLLPEIERLGPREAVRWSNGFRTWTWTYANLYARIASFSQWLADHGLAKGDRILIWGENRPEWLVAFWGAVARGVEVVPVDFRFSVELVQRIQRESHARLLVHGNMVDAAAAAIDRIGYDDIAALPRTPAISTVNLSPDDVVEIVYTSGTTGEPKGVVHRHRNICANLEPFQREIDKYKKWAAPFQPVRLLNLLPLSHMFGQSQGLFIPVLLGGAVAFSDEMRPAAIMRMVREQHVSVIACVPRILETLMHDVERRFPLPTPPSAKGWSGVARRWWIYRGIHASFGWKFWAFVVGGARVEPELEKFWAEMGFVVIQGYGLTEASPVVAVNHPFDTRRGSLGKVVPGQDVVIAPDGEILVRGESVTGERGEWLKTGDLGAIDAEGWLYYSGRKKDLIVTSEGLNVHPEDVEAVLNAQPGVRESAVVAANEQVHAALILYDAPADAAVIVGRANEKLEAHQRIRSWTIWPDPEFPRTESTMKLKRHEVARRIADGMPNSAAKLPSAASALDKLLARKPDVRLSEDLGLSSLDRVELLSEMENRYGKEWDEARFSEIKTVAELQSEISTAADAEPGGAAEGGLSAWPLYWPVRIVRSLMQHGLVLPLFRHYIPLDVRGLEYLRDISPPVIFAANHTSHLDTIALVAALPEPLRKRLAPAMSKDYFRAWFEPRNFSRVDSWKTGMAYALTRIAFNTYPLPQEMAGVKRALEYTGDLADRKYCPLVYPEGRRTPDGEIHAFRPGIGMMAVRLQIAVIPVHIAGLFNVYSIHDRWPKPGRARVSFGKPLQFHSNTAFESAAKEIEQAVREMADS